MGKVRLEIWAGSTWKLQENRPIHVSSPRVGGLEPGWFGGKEGVAIYPLQKPGVQ